jgi:hypothetical protein
MEFTALLGLLGPLSFAVALMVMGALSRRLGAQTHARRYYVGFYAAAILMLISFVAQLIDAFSLLPHNEGDLLWVLLNEGLPAIAVTIGVILAWRYWSWLLAERD